MSLSMVGKVACPPMLTSRSIVEYIQAARWFAQDSMRRVLMGQFNAVAEQPLLVQLPDNATDALLGHNLLSGIGL